MTALSEQPLRSPQQLYNDWEHAHWAAQDIDLSRDRDDWARMPERERELLHFVLSSLMVAEERISTQFCGLVLAQDDEEEGSYLSTQLVDEVRHMQFYARFQNEVIADRATIAEHVERAPNTSSAPGWFLGRLSANCSTRASSKPTTVSPASHETARRRWTS